MKPSQLFKLIGRTNDKEFAGCKAGTLLVTNFIGNEERSYVEIAHRPEGWSMKYINPKWMRSNWFIRLFHGKIIKLKAYNSIDFNIIDCDQHFYSYLPTGETPEGIS